MATLIDGKAVAAQIRAEIAGDVQAFVAARGFAPGLAVVLVGNDPASAVYVRNKRRACEEAGIRSEVYELPAETDEQTLLALIARLNADARVHGILVQLPLPPHLNEKKVLYAIDPKKDVDGFHPMNVGKMLIGTADLLPCTPAGVIELLRRSGISPEGRECVIVGRSNIVGKPLAALFLQANATVTVCHRKTRDLRAVCRRADILVFAIGEPEYFDGSYVKEGAVVVDVGVNRRPSDGKLCGDAVFTSVEPCASAITPVPGGVGPMTIAMLLKNTLIAANKQLEK